MVAGFINFVLLLLFYGQCEVQAIMCDAGKPGDLAEGNIGQAGTFPWLGVLRVHLHEGEKMRIALTGIVLIKSKYAIANADDIARIPRNIFKEDTKAMFIPTPGNPWYCGVQDFITHPEYEVITKNTIALVELKLYDDDPVPILPICWPKYSLNTGNHLFALAYTDANKILEKEIYKLQYVKPKNCKEFYQRTGFTDTTLVPAHFECAFAENSASDCVWDNGMVMASNATGTWTIVGLGTRGPGCAAPARFISMLSYMPWIDSSTDLEQINFRKLGYIKEFNASVTERISPKYATIAKINNIPLYSLYGTKNIHADPYQISFESSNIFEVSRVDDDAIEISTFDSKHEQYRLACEVLDALVYRDRTKIVSKANVGKADFRLSLYDLYMMGYSCIKVRVKCKTRSKAMIWWKTSIDKNEGTSIMPKGETPSRLLKNIPLKVRTTHPPHSDAWKPGDELEAQYLTDTDPPLNIRNINLLISFTFSRLAVLQVYVYGPKPPRSFSAQTPSASHAANTTKLQDWRETSTTNITKERDDDDIFKNFTTSPSYHAPDEKPQKRRKKRTTTTTPTTLTTTKKATTTPPESKDESGYDSDSDSVKREASYEDADFKPFEKPKPESGTNHDCVQQNKLVDRMKNSAEPFRNVVAFYPKFRKPEVNVYFRKSTNSQFSGQDRLQRAAIRKAEKRAMERTRVQSNKPTTNLSFIAIT